MLHHRRPRPAAERCGVWRKVPRSVTRSVQLLQRYSWETKNPADHLVGRVEIGFLNELEAPPLPMAWLQANHDDIARPHAICAARLPHRCLALVHQTPGGLFLEPIWKSTSIAASASRRCQALPLA